MPQKSLLEIWRESPTRRKELAELLQEPALVDALAIVKEHLYSLKSPPTGGAQYTLLDYYALFGAKQHGYIECLRKLYGLAEIQLEKTPERKPWDPPGKQQRLEKLAEEMGVPLPEELETPNA